MGARRACSARKSSVSTSAAAVNDKNRGWPWSELPPPNPFTRIPRYPETRMRGNNHITAPSITKSSQPTTTRCNSINQRPRLLHAITEKSSYPTAGINRYIQFLGPGSAIDVPTVFDSRSASYWCVLRVDSAPEITHGQPPPPPPLMPFHRFDVRGPPLMTMSGLVGPNNPSSGLVVNYAVSATIDRNMYRTKHVSIRHECATIDPSDSRNKPIEFTTSILRCRAKLYAMSLQGTLVVMQASDYRLKITGMSAIRAIPSSNWKFFKEYLVEMDGEILLVFLIYEKSLAAVDNVEVFRLNLVTLGWIRVERLGGKTMFLKEECIWVDSAEFGCMDNCVYFDHKSNDSWKIYDMKNGGISAV